MSNPLELLHNGDFSPYQAQWIFLRMLCRRRLPSLLILSSAISSFSGLSLAVTTRWSWGCPYPPFHSRSRILPLFLLQGTEM